MNFSVPATSANLGPGFDSLGLSLNLRNYFSIQHSKKGEISLLGEGSENPRFLSNNLFVKIFTKIYRSLGGEGEFSFSFYNNIPLSRGLGSSSAVIVGAIFSAYKMAGEIPNKQVVLDIALQYERHPDNITSAVFGGFNSAILNAWHGIDGVKSIVSIKKRIPKNIKAVVVIPNKPIYTKYSRSILPKYYSSRDCVFNISHSSLLSSAFFSERWDILREASLDCIHESMRMRSMPVLFKIQKSALANGALMSTLSGSGSTIISVCHTCECSSLKSILSTEFPYFRVLALDFDNDGVKIESSSIKMLES